MERKQVYLMWYKQCADPEVVKHYTRFGNPSTDTLEALAEAYVWEDLYDMLTGPFGLDWYDEAVSDFMDEADCTTDVDRWRFTADLLEDVGTPFSRIIIALDMYINWMFDDEIEDSIGRMEDYDVC